MRKINATFQTQFISEAGSKLLNNDYFAFVELYKLACYVIVDGIDDAPNQQSGRLVVESIIRSFIERPSFKKRALKEYIKRAHRTLQAESQEMHLKAAVTVIVTDYAKFRYVQVGNTRFALLRNGRMLYKTEDQSLSQQMVQSEQLAKDKIAAHEERHNLYNYLGQDGFINPLISKKLKLEVGDMWYLYTRGIWEYCDEGELIDASEEAKTPQEVIDKVEELILAKTPETIDNYAAQDAYLAAQALSEQNDLLGAPYIEKKLAKVKDCIDVLDLLQEGDKNLDNGEVDLARAAYQAAKTLANENYFQEAKAEAIEKIDKIDSEKAADKKAAQEEKAKQAEKEKEEKEAQKAQEEADKAAAQEAADKLLETKLAALEVEKKGNTSYTIGSYEDAQMYYLMAQEMYQEAGLVDRADGLQEKISLSEQKQTALQSLKAKADTYVQTADEKAIGQFYQEARMLYIIAKGIYQDVELEEEITKVDEKIIQIDAILMKSE